MRIVTTTRRLQPWPEDHLLGPPVTYPDGTTIFRKGQPIRTISVVVSGIVLVLASGESEDGLVAVRTSDWPLAAVPPIDGRSMHVATAVALGPCELRQIHVPAFLELRLRDPRVNIWIGNLLAAEAMEQLEWLVALSAGDLRARLLHVLVALFRASSVERPDGSLRLRPAISRTLLAKLVLAERESVVRQIGRLETEGVITRADGWIEVPASSSLNAAIRTVPVGSVSTGASILSGLVDPWAERPGALSRSKPV